MVQYVTPSLSVIAHCHELVKGNLFSSWLLFLKKFDVIEWNIFQELTYNIDSQSCAIRTHSVINYAGVPGNIIFMFSHLMLVPCWAQVMVGTVSQQEEHNNENKITYNGNIHQSSGSYFKDGF